MLVQILELAAELEVATEITIPALTASSLLIKETYESHTAVEVAKRFGYQNQPRDESLTGE